MSKPEGYLFVDHRASPGIPADQALRMGLDPNTVKEGAVLEAATMRCAHCPSVYIKNPLRTRERGYCFSCAGFVCDACQVASKLPGYVHQSAQEVIDKVQSGKFVMSGSTSLPILTPKGTNDG